MTSFSGTSRHAVQLRRRNCGCLHLKQGHVQVLSPSLYSNPTALVAQAGLTGGMAFVVVVSRFGTLGTAGTPLTNWGILEPLRMEDLFYFYF